MRKYLLKHLFATLAICAAGEASAQCTATLTNFGSNTCEYDSLLFQSYPLGASQYEWFVNGVSQGMGGSMHYDNQPAGTYTYYVVITDNNNCVAQSNPITVTLATAPTVSVSNNGPICAGGTLQLNATSNGTTYSWWGPNGFASTQQNPQIINAQPVNSGYYYLNVSNGNCTTTAMTNVVVNNNTPTVTASVNSTNICAGDSFYLHTTVTGLTGTTYSWTGPNGFSSTLPNPDIQNSTSVNSGTYTVSVTGNGCSGPVTLSSSVTVTVTNGPVITVANNGPICAGNTLQLTGTVSSGTYSWIGPGSFTSTQLNPSISNAQPGNSGIYILHAVDNGCAASAMTNAVVMSNNSYAGAWSDSMACVGGSFTVNASTSGITGATYSWTGPNGFASTTSLNTISPATLADAGTYTVTVTGTGCSGPVTITASTNVNVSNCDSVWPGDANSDFVASNQDVLYVGLGYGSTGPARVGASNNWVAQFCNNWNNTFNNGANYRHADCNGDGTIDSLDNIPVFLNYGQTHQKGGHFPMAKTTGFPDLFFDMSNVTLIPGATVTIPIKLGTSSVMMQNMYGIAAEVKINGITPTTDMTVIGNAGWMGTSANTMSFQKAVSTTQTDWTFVRTNHSNISGEGVIGMLTFTVPMGTDNQMVDLYFENVKIINSNGDDIQDFNVIDGAATVIPTSVATTSSVINSAVIAPNPSDAHAVLQITAETASKVQIIVTDMVGKTVWSSIQSMIAGPQQILLPATEVTPGIYTVLVKDEKGAIAQTIKWVKK